MKESITGVPTKITKTEGDLGEILPKAQPLVCPTCERNFEELRDFPRLDVISVSHIITPENVPAEITCKSESLLDVPQEVVEYFCKYPEVDKLVHSDSYIYTRPYLQTEEYRKMLERDPEHFRNIKIIEGNKYHREYNWASTIRSLLLEGSPLNDYLKTLKSFEGQEVRTEDVYPEWERGDIPKDIPKDIPIIYREIIMQNAIRRRTPRYIIPGYESLQVDLKDIDLFFSEGSAYLGIETRKRALLKNLPNKVEIERYKGWGLAEIGIWHEEDQRTTRLLVIGEIKYAGRISKAVPFLGPQDLEHSNRTI